jgi:hypothetical protein
MATSDSHPGFTNPLDDDPGPPPITRPAVRPKARPVVADRPLPPATVEHARSHGALELIAVGVAGFFLAVFLTAWLLAPKLGPSPSPGPAPSVNAVALGRSFAPRLASALADGFDAEAAAIEAGKTVAEADATLKATFHDARARAFADHAAAPFAALVPPGSEPKDEGTRRAFAGLHRDFAKGLRGARTR